MSTTAELLQGIINSKAAIKTSIANKGVTVPENAMLADCPALIDSISQGSGGEPEPEIEFFPEIIDLYFDNVVENETTTDVDAVMRVCSNGFTISEYYIQYRPKGTTTWLSTPSVQVTENTNEVTNYVFDKRGRTTISGLLFKHIYDENLGALVENINDYEVRAYIVYNSLIVYSKIRTYTTGWGKYFDNIYINSPNLELNNTKQKRYMAIIVSSEDSKILSDLGGDYYITSDGYVGVSENHIFNSNLDIPIYCNNGIDIKYYVRWVIVYTNTGVRNISTYSNLKIDILYCYFGDCNLSYSFTNSNNKTPILENVRFSPACTFPNNSIGDNYSVKVFQYCRNLKNIIIPSNVIRIGYFCFYECDSLKNIILPDSCITFEQYSFQETGLESIRSNENVEIIYYMLMYFTGDFLDFVCFKNIAKNNSSKRIKLPNSITTLKSEMFIRFSALEYVELSTNISTILGYGHFEGCSKLIKIKAHNLPLITERMFRQCTDLANINIPEGATSIGNNAFSECYTLTSTNIIPSSVTSLGSSVFFSCSILTSVVFSSSVTTIGQSLFQDCRALTKAQIPDTVVLLGSRLFSGCSRLKEAYLPVGSQMPDTTEVFKNCSLLTVVKIPNTITSIGNQMFYGCGLLIDFKIPNSVTSIGSEAFYNCRKLRRIELPNGLTSLGAYAFSGCWRLEEIIFPETIQTIGNYAITGSNVLESVVFPASLSTLGIYVLQSNPLLVSVEFKGIPASLPTSSIFYSCPVSVVKIPNGWNKTLNIKSNSTATEVLTHKCMLDIFNNLASGVTGLTLTLGATNLARMTADEIAIATAKGWTVN